MLQKFWCNFKEFLWFLLLALISVHCTNFWMLHLFLIVACNIFTYVIYLHTLHFFVQVSIHRTKLKTANSDDQTFKNILIREHVWKFLLHGKLWLYIMAVVSANYHQFFIVYKKSSVKVRVLCQEGGSGVGGSSSLIGQKSKMVDGKQSSDWTIIQDGNLACDWTEFKMADGKAVIWLDNNSRWWMEQDQAE